MKIQVVRSSIEVSDLALFLNTCAKIEIVDDPEKTVVEELHRSLDQAHAQIEELTHRSENKIPAIKAIRNVSGMRLRDAKLFVEAIQAGRDPACAETEIYQIRRAENESYAEKWVQLCNRLGYSPAEALPGDVEVNWPG